MCFLVSHFKYKYHNNISNINNIASNPTAREKKRKRKRKSENEKKKLLYITIRVSDRRYRHNLS